MTGQLASLCQRVNEIKNDAKPKSTPLFGPRLDHMILQCRDPPPSNFRLTRDPSVPILMIAAGSGVAPFIGFLEEWEKIRGQNASLIFGCRNEESFIYKKKLEEFKEKGVLKGLHLAFSRIEPKKYVQDIVTDMKQDVIDLIDRNGIVYVCGDGAGMGLAIKNCFIEIFGKEKYFELMEQKRIREDLWR